MVGVVQKAIKSTRGEGRSPLRGGLVSWHGCSSSIALCSEASATSIPLRES